MLKELEQTSSVISLEAHCGEASLESAIGQLPGFIGKLRGFIENKTGDVLRARFVGMRPFNFQASIKKTTYTDFKHVEVFVPQGMTVPFLTYGNVLSESMDLVLAMEEKVLDPYIKWLAERLGQPSSFASIQSSLKTSGFTPAALEKVEQNVHNCFVKGGQKQSTMLYPKAIARQGDWEEVTRQLESLETRLNGDLHRRLNEKVSRVDDLLGTLVRRLESAPEQYKLSPTTLSDLSSVAFTVARQIEFYGLTKYRVEEYATAVNDSIEKLKTFVK